MAGSIRQPLPPIFRLTVDCCDEIFDYLSMKDLHSFGQTCKSFQKVAGEYFIRNHCAAAKFLDPDGVYTVYTDNKGVSNARIRTVGFNQYINYISHYYYDIAPLNYIKSHSNQFKSLNHIYLVCVDLDKTRVDCIKNLLANIEIVQIRNSTCDDDLYELLLKSCGKLKRLLIQDADFSAYRSNDSENRWLLHEYQKLEYLELIPKYRPKIKELIVFFTKNPNVKGFSTSSKCLWENRNDFLKSKVKLDTLEVKVFPEDFYDFDYYHMVDSDDNDDDDNDHEVLPKTEDGSKIPSLCKLLKNLHEQGFYKHLQFYIETVDESTSVSLTSLPALEKLCIKKFSQINSLIQLINLKELAIYDGANPADMEIFANNFVNLRRLYLANAKIGDILPFIRYSPNLTKIKVVPKDGNHFNGGFLNLSVMNKEREKLFAAQKVTIFVPDDIFLNTKWTKMDGNTDLRLVEMKRADSIEWDNHY